jgi:hypothetical protein
MTVWPFLKVLLESLVPQLYEVNAVEVVEVESAEQDRVVAVPVPLNP